MTAKTYDQRCYDLAAIPISPMTNDTDPIKLRMINVVDASLGQSRKGYHLSLGSLIAGLAASPGNKPVLLDSGGSADRPHSYRGYYEDLALRPTENIINAGGLLAQCRAVLGATLEGYKGGNYQMKADTPLWVSHYGTTSGLALIGIEDAGNALILLTKQIEG